MEIRSAKYIISSPRAELCPKPDRPEYAFIGRSNVGKSSLINMLTRHAGLAKTSRTPGKTQLINHFFIEGMEGGAKSGTIPRANAPTLQHSWYLVDLPGYGYAKVSQSQRVGWEKMIAGYLKTRENLINVFVLIDARHEPQRIDLDFLGKLGGWGIPFNPVFTKADKSTQRDVAANVRRFVDAMREEWEYIPRSFVTSAEKFLGRKELLGYIEELNTAWEPPV